MYVIESYILYFPTYYSLYRERRKRYNNNKVFEVFVVVV